MLLNLRTRLSLIIVLQFVFGLIGATASYLTIDSIRSNFDRLANDNLPVSLSLQELAYRGSRVNSSVNELIADLVLREEEEAAQGEASLPAESEEAEARASGEQTEIVENVEAFIAELDNYRALLTRASVPDPAAFAEVIAIGERLIAAARTIRLDERVNLAELTEVRELLEDIEDEFVAQTEQLIAQEAEQLAESQAAVTAAAQSNVVAFIALIVIAILTLIAVNVYLRRTILKPLGQLTETAAKLKAGDLTARSAITSSDELGQFASAFNTMADSIQTKIAETEAARAAAEESSRVKSAFLASMSHELRTPLNAVINFTRFVVDGDMGEVNQEQADILNEVVGSGRHLLSLINDVLDMSKIESGSLNLFVEDDISLNSLIDRAISTGESLLIGKPVRIVRDVEADLPLMRGDRQRILQILLNIISNACKFTEEGTITVRVRRQGDEVLIAVTDTGVGIKPEDQPLVFDAFRQTTSGLRQAGGTGLGMPIARSLAQAHGGRIWLESTWNIGTTFHVALPIRPEALAVTVV
jgi:signal transduction histidine kinase